MAYIDDLLCVNSTKDGAKATVTETCRIFQELGFIVYPIKLQFEPSQITTFLGFIINTINMTVSLPENKCRELSQMCTEVLESSQLSIRDVAVLIGKMISALPATEFGKLHYRALERDKIFALKCNMGHFDRPIAISDTGRDDII